MHWTHHDIPIAKVTTSDGDRVEVYDDGTTNPAILIRDADGPAKEVYAVLNSDQADAILAALARAVHISIPALKEEPHPWPCEKVAGHRHDKPDSLEPYIEDLIELAAKGQAGPASWVASDIRRILTGTLDYQPLRHCAECGTLIEEGNKCEGCDDLTPDQQRRLAIDPRLSKPCGACEHPGYMHQDAERQYDRGLYGVPVFEAGDILCEATQDVGGYEGGCTCEWYESDNWKEVKS